MATVVEDQTLVEEVFSRGIVRDTPRSLIPQGGVYDATDFMVEKPGMVYKRGGWAYQSDAFGTTGKATPAVMTLNSPVRVIGIGENNTAYDITGGSSASIGSVGHHPSENPPTYVGRIIVTDSATLLPPRKVYWTGAALAVGALGGSPPTANLSTVHASRIVLGRTVLHPNFLYFSSLPDVEASWDPDSGLDSPAAIVETTHELTALASCQGVLLCFSGGAFERILGGIPPGTEGENMEVQPVASVGCIDARSVVQIDGSVLFANHAGVWITNGGAPENLMEKEDASGILSYWRSLFSAAEFTACSAGMLGRDLYYVNVLGAAVSGAYTAVGALLCYLPTRSWTRVTNLSALMLASGLSEAGTHRLFAALSNTNRAAALEGFLAPTAANKRDGDGTAVAPMLELRPFAPGPGVKAYGHAHVSYDMRDAATDDPTLAVTAASGMEAATFAAVPESPLAETSDQVRRRVSLNRDSQACTVRLAQTGPSSKTEVYLLEADVRPYGTQADGQ